MEELLKQVKYGTFLQIDVGGGVMYEGFLIRLIPGSNWEGPVLEMWMETEGESRNFYVYARRAVSMAFEEGWAMSAVIERSET